MNNRYHKFIGQVVLDTRAKEISYEELMLHNTSFLLCSVLFVSKMLKTSSITGCSVKCLERSVSHMKEHTIDENYKAKRCK